MKYLLITLSLFLIGCGGNNRSTILFPSDKQVIAQQEANRGEAVKALVEQSSNKEVALQIADSINGIEINLDKIIGIDSHPKPEVYMQDWIDNPFASKSKIDKSAKDAGNTATSIGKIIAATAEIGSMIIVGVKVLNKLSFLYPPAVAPLAMLDHLIAFGQHPNEASANDTIHTVLADAKQMDPNNPVIAKIDAALTTKEKDFVVQKNRV